MTHGLITCACLAWTLAVGNLAWAEDEQPAQGEKLKQAQAVFESFQKLERAFDPQVADLYAEGAVIRMRRLYPNGAKRDVEINGRQIKELLPQAMPLAKERGDTNEYRELKYTVDGGGVRISGVRYSNLKKSTNGWTLLVKPDAAGKWLIQEETTEIQVPAN